MGWGVGWGVGWGRDAVFLCQLSFRVVLVFQQGSYFVKGRAQAGFGPTLPVHATKTSFSTLRVALAGVLQLPSAVATNGRMVESRFGTSRHGSFVGTHQPTAAFDLGTQRRIEKVSTASKRGSKVVKRVNAA